MCKCDLSEESVTLSCAGVEEMELVTHDLSETPLVPPDDTNHQEVESPFNPVPMSKRQKVKFVLCRGLIALIGVGMVVVSGALAGLLRHPDLDVLCQSVDTCCSNYTHPARIDIAPTSSSNWLATPDTVSCVCSTSASMTLTPTPLYV